MEGLTALIGLDFNLHEILTIVFYCQRFSKFKREHSGFLSVSSWSSFCPRILSFSLSSSRRRY